MVQQILQGQSLTCPLLIGRAPQVTVLRRLVDATAQEGGRLALPPDWPPDAIRQPSPLLGQQTEEVFREGLDLSDAEINALIVAQAV